MITSIAVKNTKGNTLTLTLKSPALSGFFVSNIDGLGPVKATINETEALTLDGSTFNSARVGSRNIVLDLGFLDYPTIEATRQISYTYFALKSLVELTIVSDTKTVKISGYIESNEPVIFQSMETTSISIICPDPYFRDLNNIIINFSLVSPGFKFPFSNNSTSLKLISFGSVNLDPQNTINYTGQVDIGFILSIHASGPVHNLSIYSAETAKQLSIDSATLIAMTGSDITAGDDIVISTVKGNKYIFLIRAGVTINILNAATNLAWFSLVNGNNTFYYLAESGSEFLAFKTTYTNVYEGV